MADDTKKFLSQEDLIYFNKTVNDRLIARLKYKADLEIDPVWTDWSVLAPTEIGHLYYLTGSSKVTISNITYAAGDWVIVMNKIIKNDDGSLVDVDGNPAAVAVRKLGSSGLPLGELDGDGLAFVNGEWALQRNYGWYEPGPQTDVNYDLPIDADGKGWCMSGPTLVEGKPYSITIDTLYHKEGVAYRNADGDIAVELDAPWKDLVTLPDGKTYLRAIPGEKADTLVRVTIAGESEGIYHKFDKRYIDSSCLIIVRELPDEVDAEEHALYLLVTNGFDPSSLRRMSLSDELTAAGYTTTEDGVFDDEGELLYKWSQAAANFADLNDMFKDDVSGHIWYYTDEGDAVILYSDTAPSTDVADHYRLYTYDRTELAVPSWIELWSSVPACDDCIGIENAFIRALEAW